MPRRVQIYRHTTTVLADAFTGLAGEPSIDLEKGEMRVHDGSTAGGRPMLRADLANARIPNGTAAAPIINFAADPDTGIYRDAANVLGFATGGAARAKLSDTALTLSSGVDLLLNTTSLTTELADLQAGVDTALTRNVLGGAGTTITTATTLTASSERVRPVAMTTDAQSVTLPDATTPPEGGPLFVFPNTGTRTFGVRDNAGTLLAAVPAGGVAELYLRDNSTAAGSWTVSGAGLLPAFTIVDATLPSTLTQSSQTAVRLTDALSLHFAQNASGHPFVVAVDHSPGGLGVGTPVLISAVNQVIAVAYRLSDAKAVAVIEGSSSNVFNVTVAGNTCTVSSSASASVYSSIGLLSTPLVALLGVNNDVMVCAQVNASAVRVQAVDCSGTNPSAGATVNQAASGVQNVFGVYRVSATTAVVIYIDDSGSAGSPYSVRAVVVTLSGSNTLAFGTSAGVNDVTNANFALPVAVLSATSYIVGYFDTAGGNLVRAVHISVSGTTVTFGTPLTVETLSGGAVSFALLNANAEQPNLYALSSTTALFTYGAASGSIASRHVVLSNAAGVLTAGSILYGIWTDAAGGNFPQDAAGFLAISGGTAYNQIYGVSATGNVLKIEGVYGRFEIRVNQSGQGYGSTNRFALSGGIRGVFADYSSGGPAAVVHLFKFAYGAPVYLGAVNMTAVNASSYMNELASNKAGYVAQTQTQVGQTAGLIRIQILEFTA